LLPLYLAFIALEIACGEAIGDAVISGSDAVDAKQISHSPDNRSIISRCKPTAALIYIALHCETKPTTDTSGTVFKQILLRALRRSESRPEFGSPREAPKAAGCMPFSGTV
jgi:hypothetical protein